MAYSVPYLDAIRAVRPKSAVIKVVCTNGGSFKQGPRFEGPRAGMGHKPPSPPARGLESDLSSPSGVRDTAPAQVGFGVFWGITPAKNFQNLT